MVPRSAIEGIDIEDDWEEIVNQLATSHHTRLPVYRGTLDNVVGVLHIRRVLHISQGSEFNKESLLEVISEPFFIPEGTRLTQQLLTLQRQRRQLSLVVDEYGDLKGLVTLAEILEEIVGEFTHYVPGIAEDVRDDEDGWFLINGQANIRELNRKMDWQLPIDGPKTLNGLILEFLEHIPESGTRFKIADYQIEIVQKRGTAVSVVRLLPPPKTETLSKTVN